MYVLHKQALTLALICTDMYTCVRVCMHIQIALYTFWLLILNRIS